MPSFSPELGNGKVVTSVRDCVISRTALGFVRTLRRTMGARRYHRGKHCFAKLFTSSLVRAELLQFFEMVVFFRTIAESFKSLVDRLSPIKISSICLEAKHLVCQVLNFFNGNRI